ncbi:MAG: protein kinase, partial [Planctomycetes bacterium]|nr:protein kinase [Planctomycetota bacterium]
MAFTDADETRSPGDEGTRREPAGSPAPGAATGTRPETEPRGVPPAGLPSTLGPYRLLSELGRGGMGVVYRAFHPGLKRTVALKVLVAGEDASDEAIARFRREAEAVARLGHHPHIVPVYDIGQEGRRHYFAMHLVEGRPLDRILDEGPLPPREAARIAMRVAEALSHAHGHGVLHRDVKPANILLANPDGPDRASRESDSPDGASRQPDFPDSKGGESGIGEPMLTDFGLAKDVQSDSRMTRSGTALGTPNYMPPEQAEGRHSAVDARSDVWSLGATLYEMLTARPPFEGDSVAAVLKRVLLEDPPSPRRGNPAVDRDFETICLKCLEKDPRARYASARELAEDLGRALEGRPIVARPASALERLWKRARRNRAAAAALASLAVLLAAGAALGAWGLGQIGTEKGGRQEAEHKERESLDRLKKSERVARVLLAAQTRYARIQAELRALSSLRDSDPGRATRAEALRRKILEFGAGIPDDPASQAALLAVQGWLHFHGRMEEQAFPLLRRAQEADPGVPWGFLFEAMAWLARYLSLQPLPDTVSSAAGVAFGEVPPETEPMRQAREEFARLVEAAGLAKAWGSEASGEFAAALEGFRAIHRQDLEAAERGLGKALAVPEFDWIREDILQARARVRYQRKDFEGGLGDVEAALAEYPDSLALLLLKGMLLIGDGSVRLASGKSPEPRLLEAVQAFRAAVAIDPEGPGGHQQIGTALTRLAQAEEARGADPRPTFRLAVESHARAAELLPGDARLHANLSNALRDLGDAEAFLGGDAGPWLDKALAAAEESVRAAPDFPGGRSARGLANLSRGEALLRRGADARSLLESA